MSRGGANLGTGPAMGYKSSQAVGLGPGLGLVSKRSQLEGFHPGDEGPGLTGLTRPLAVSLRTS